MSKEAIIVFLENIGNFSTYAHRGIWEGNKNVANVCVFHCHRCERNLQINNEEKHIIFQNVIRLQLTISLNELSSGNLGFSSPDCTIICAGKAREHQFRKSCQSGN